MRLPAPLELRRPSPRQRFVRELTAICGDVRFLWTPDGGDRAVSVDASPFRRPIVWDADVQARLSRLGLGWAQVFDGSDDVGTVADSPSLSFGTQALSVVAVANVTDTASARTFVAKRNVATPAREYRLIAGGGDALAMMLFDEDNDVEPFRNSDAAITQGAWAMFGASCANPTGATAVTDTVLYENGAVKASTAFNEAAFEQMRDTTAELLIGGDSALMTGSMALVLICAGALSAAQHAAIKAAVNRYFGLTL